MSQYLVKSIDQKNYSLLQNEIELSSLAYTNWTLTELEIIINNSIFEIKPKGFWGTTKELKLNDTLILSIKLDWKGNMILHFEGENEENDFLFKRNGIFSNSYVLQNSQDDILLEIKPDFKWNKLKFEFNIETNDILENMNNKYLLIMCTLFCTKQFIRMASSAAV